MRSFEKELKNKEINETALLKYGFTKVQNGYVYHTTICDEQFEMIVEVQGNQMTSKLIDCASEEEYVLADIEDSVGEFVGRVRSEYEQRLQEILDSCTIRNAFKGKQAKDIIAYIQDKYGDELEFLWEKFDNIAIWRNKQNEKWYGLIGVIPANKIGLDSDKEIEIINLRYGKDEADKMVDGKVVFPGYHMNKKSWITIILDGAMETKRLCDLIDNSYALSVGNKCGLTGKHLSQQVFEYLTTIPKGKVVTYGQIAKHLGNRGLARAVGNILHQNPDGDKYPCYKVLNSKGELSPAFVFGGPHVQQERLEKDGIKVVAGKVDLKKYQWEEE